MKTRVAIIFIFIFLLNNKTSIKGQENIICTGVILRRHLLPDIFVHRVVCPNWYIILLSGKGLFYFCSVSCVPEKIGLECIKAIFERRKLTKILE
jgi:hypothetical protein